MAVFVSRNESSDRLLGSAAWVKVPVQLGSLNPLVEGEQLPWDFMDAVRVKFGGPKGSVRSTFTLKFRLAV